jgi:nitrogenase subunit NifH
VTVPDNFKERKESPASASLAGASGGTLVALLANQIPDENTAKVLLYLAPSISILFTFLWGWTQVKLIDYLNDKKAVRLTEKAKRILESIIADPNTSEEYREISKKKLEGLNTTIIDRIESQIQAIPLYTSGNIESKTSLEKSDLKLEIDD